MQSDRDLAVLLSRAHLPALDGVRALAVLIVILGHASAAVGPGDLGVSAFFVLSGFLITWLLLRERSATGSVSLRSFYLRRVLRIFPAYYAFLGASIAADAWLGDPWSAGMTLTALFYLVNYYNAFLGHPASGAAHCWSLAVEEQFYLVWPWLFRRIVPCGRGAIGRALAGLCVVVLVWRCVLFLGFDVGESYVYNAFDTRFDSLAAGCLLAVALDSPRARAGAVCLARFAWMPLPTMLAIWVSRTKLGSTWHYGPGFTVEAVLLAILLAQWIQLAGSATWSWLEHPITRYVGRISYPMYLWHGWGLTAARGTTRLGEGFDVLLGLLIALASASYHLLERPFLRLKSRFETPRSLPA